MAIQSLLGTIGNDVITASYGSETTVILEALNGDDKVTLNTDQSNSSLNLDGGDDDLLITSTGSSNPTIRLSTVRGGQGNDVIEVRTRSGADLQVWGDFGDDDIQLTHVGIAGQIDNASFVRTTILGDNTDVIGEGDDLNGIDTVYIDSHVARFNQSLVDLGDNQNSIVGNVEDAVIDFLASGDELDLLSLDIEAVLVQAGEVFQSTFRGGAGDDAIVFDSLLNPFEGKAGTTALDSSLVNGNAGSDAIAILRDVDTSTISGGQGVDYFTALSGTNRFAKYNGNLGSDVLNIGNILSQNSSFYGGKGSDTLNIGAAVATNSLISGDLGADRINYFAANSTNTTLSGGDGNDQIDDYSTAITSLGNVLDGGDGDDRLRQAANIVLSGVTDFGSTIIGGKGADVMTGDSDTQVLGPKQVDAAGTAIEGASKDLFRFSFGDSVINSEGVGHDEITDFDSNASSYLANGLDPAVTTNFSTLQTFASPGNIPGQDFTGVAAPEGPGLNIDALTPLERDVIDLTNANISFGESVALGGGAGTAIVNSKGLVIGNVDNITEFVQAGSLQAKAGQAIVWCENPNPVAEDLSVNQLEEFRRSWLFISDGDGVLSNGDLLIELKNVSFDTKDNDAGLVINGGNITDMIFA